MAEGSSIIVNIGDLDVSEQVAISVDDILITSAATGPTTLKPDDENALIAGVAEAWRTKAFADVEVICGVDGGTFLTHRIFLASLSSFLRHVLKADAIGGSCPHETTCLILPDVDSAVLSNFLSKVCNGSKETASTSPSLSHLGFHQRPFASKIKPEFEEIGIGIEDEDEEDDDLQQICEQSTLEDLNESGDGKKKSVAWKFFEKIDQDAAMCKLCQLIVKTVRGNTSGMGRHMRRYHPLVYQSHNMSFQFGYSKNSSSGSKDLKKRSIVWKFFIKQENKSAMCTICNSVIRTEASNTSGMGRHLRRYHPEIPIETILGEEDPFEAEDAFEWPLEVEAHDSMEVQLTEDDSAQTKNRIWDSFERQVSGDFATCLNCGVSVKTEGGNTSGMTRHLKKTHPDIWQTLDGTFAAYPAAGSDADIFAYDDDAVKGRLRSLVWNYYVREDKTTAICAMCNATVKTGMGNTSGMARHLRRSHPNEYQEFREASRLLQPEEDVKPKLTRTRKQPLTSGGATSGEVQTVMIDPLRDIWQFFNDVSGGESDAAAGNQDGEGQDECSAICKFCRLQLVFTFEDVQPLIDHLKGEHQDKLDEAATTIIKTEEGLSSDEMSYSRSSGKPPHTRSAIWKFFKRTNDRLRNECQECGKVMLCSSQNTTSMIRHLERRHHDLFLAFLHESGNKEETIKKATEKKLLKSLKTENDPTDPTNRTCPVCFKVYWHKRAMLYHKKVVHSGERPYKCKDCNMSFARLDCYQKHSHNVEKKYLCSHCGKTFGRKSARDLHERAHRGDRRYSCVHCAKMFMTNQALQKHERIHTGEKPYQCKDCGKQFTQQHQLTTHIRIHTGEKPYGCDFCDLKFRHLSSKSKHRCEGKMMAAKWMTNNSNSVTILMDPNMRAGGGHESE